MLWEQAGLSLRAGWRIARAVDVDVDVDVAAAAGRRYVTVALDNQRLLKALTKRRIVMNKLLVSSAHH
jgi:hypothetical protein